MLLFPAAALLCVLAFAITGHILGKAAAFVCSFGGRIEPPIVKLGGSESCFKPLDGYRRYCMSWPVLGALAFNSSPTDPRTVPQSRR